jgi:hypothetical protein
MGGKGGRGGRGERGKRGVPSMVSRGVGSRDVVWRPARWAGRRVVMEWGSRSGVRAPPKKLFFFLIFI